MNKRTFVISELMQNNFIEETEQKVLLEETEESGKSLLLSLIHISEPTRP